MSKKKRTQDDRDYPGFVWSATNAARRDWIQRVNEVAVAASGGNATMIAESGVRAAQKVNADYGWIPAWADSLRPILRDSYVEAIELMQQKDNTWPNRIKKAFWYIVGIIVTAIVTYYVALAGFRT